METKNWLWPVPYTKDISRGYYVTKDASHTGIDIVTTDISGKNVYAGKDGVVSAIYAGCNNVNGYNGSDCSSKIGCTGDIKEVTQYDSEGNGIKRKYCDWGIGRTVFIKHNDTTYSQYLHLADICVELNDEVKKGQLIGTVGSTGQSTGPHLHFSLSTNSSIADGRVNNNKEVIDYRDSVEVVLDLNYAESEPIYMAYAHKTDEYPETKYEYFPPVEREGYDFVGWYTERTGGTLFDVGTIVPDYDHTLYAHWNERVTTVSVTFNANGGSVTPATKTFTVGSTYSGLPTPSKTGYDFVGWYDALVGGNPVSGTKITNTETHVVYAHWDPVDVNVTLMLDGGTFASGTTVPTKLKFAASYATLPDPIKTGYTFLGWYDSATFDTRLDDPGSPVNVSTTAAHSVYARWEPISVSITLGGMEGASLPSGVSSPVNLDYDESYVNLPTPTKPGYDFLGWYDSATDGTRLDDPSAPVIMRTVTSHTVYAQWGPVFVTIYLTGGVGSVFPNGDTVRTSIMRGYTLKYGYVPTPTKVGYDFGGWINPNVSNEPIDNISDTVVSDYNTHGLYAKWIPNTYTVTRNYNDGRDNDTATVTFDSAYGNVAAPVSRTGYTFLGWYDETTSVNVIREETVVSIAEDHTINAVWAPNDYCIILDYNDGVSDRGAFCATYGRQIGEFLSPTSISREGYVFDGWWDDCNDVRYTPTSIMDVAEDLVLTAHWLETTKLTLDYNRYGGVKDEDPKVYEVLHGRRYIVLHSDSDLTLLDDTNGAYLSGWYTARIGGEGPYDKVSFVSNQNDHTLYAQWMNGTQRTVSFDANGGICEDTMKAVTCGSPYGELPVPTKENSTFLGWYLTAQSPTDEEDIEVLADTVVPFPHDHVLFARWAQVKISFNSAEGSACAPVYRAIDGTYGDLPVPTREGFIFNGWYYNGIECTYQCELIKNTNHTLTAQWIGE